MWWFGLVSVGVVGMVGFVGFLCLVVCVGVFLGVDVVLFLCWGWVCGC